MAEHKGFSPAPWAVESGDMEGTIEVCDANGGTVAYQVTGDLPGEREANATLIADAPNLVATIAAQQQEIEKWRKKYLTLTAQNLIEFADSNYDAWLEFIAEYPEEVRKLRSALYRAQQSNLQAQEPKG